MHSLVQNLSWQNNIYIYINRDVSYSTLLLIRVWKRLGSRKTCTSIVSIDALSILFLNCFYAYVWVKSKENGSFMGKTFMYTNQPSTIQWKSIQFLNLNSKVNHIKSFHDIPHKETLNPTAWPWYHFNQNSSSHS